MGVDGKIIDSGFKAMIHHMGDEGPILKGD